MPQSLAPIPLESEITEKDGTITSFFRLRWQQLIDGFVKTPTIAVVGPLLNQNAAIATTRAYTTLASGLYRISYYMRKTTADGVNSSLTFTVGWTETGVGLTESAAALVTDTTLAQQSGTKLINADANSDITFAIAYASNTPGQMKYRLEVMVERMA